MVKRVTPSVTQTQKSGPPLEQHDVLVEPQSSAKGPLPSVITKDGIVKWRKLSGGVDEQRASATTVGREPQRRKSGVHVLGCREQSRPGSRKADHAREEGPHESASARETCKLPRTRQFRDVRRHANNPEERRRCKKRPGTKVSPGRHPRLEAMTEWPRAHGGPW